MVTSFYLTPEGKLLQAISDEQMRAAVKTGKGVLWVDFEGATQDETFMLDEVFNFHPLSIEDCQQQPRLPKIDEFPTHQFVIFIAPDPKKDPMAAEEGGSFRHIALFLGRNYLVTYHPAPSDAVASLTARVRRDAATVLSRGADFMANDVIDNVVDQYFPIVDKFHASCERLEDHAMDPNQKDMLARILDMKRKILSLRRLMSDHREVLQRMMRSPHPVVSEKANMYYRDIHDHLGTMEGDLDVCRDTIDGARDLSINMANLRVQEIIRVLTVLFTVTLPGALITSFYGMNFAHLPFKDHEVGFWGTMGVTLALTAAIYVWLRRKRML